jgi:hypothetical protein
MINWENVLNQLASYPPHVHRILPPCPAERVETLEQELGSVPTELAEMLRHFNGARLFIDGGPLVSIFGVSVIPPLPPLEWSPDWYIDKYTPAWRTFSERSGDWAIGMMNYGGLVLLSRDNTVLEWDTGQGRFEDVTYSFSEWVEHIMCEGATYMSE